MKTHSVVVHKSVGTAYQYGVDVIDRVYDFCLKYDSDYSPNVYAAVVAENIFSQETNMLVLAAVLDDGVKGHLVASVESIYGGEPFVTISQCHIDGDISSSGVVSEMLYTVVEWANNLGCKSVRCVARNAPVARLFKMKYGFEESGRVIMELPV